MNLPGCRSADPSESPTPREAPFDQCRRHQYVHEPNATQYGSGGGCVLGAPVLVPILVPARLLVSVPVLASALALEVLPPTQEDSWRPLELRRASRGSLGCHWLVREASRGAPSGSARTWRASRLSVCHRCSEDAPAWTQRKGRRPSGGDGVDTQRPVRARIFRAARQPVFPGFMLVSSLIGRAWPDRNGGFLADKHKVAAVRGVVPRATMDATDAGPTLPNYKSTSRAHRRFHHRE